MLIRLRYYMLIRMRFHITEINVKLINVKYYFPRDVSSKFAKGAIENGFEEFY